MQGQMEVEEILEQKAWADRNGVELGAAYTPADALRAHEAKTYRDCPREYEMRDDVFTDMGGRLIVLATLVVLGALGYFAWSGGNWLAHVLIH